jgi:predicted ATPase/DNA-binding CsgD family transcriptional regulator/GAF domain-containing protein
MTKRGGIALKQLMNETRWEVPSFIDIAIELAEIVQTVHKQNSIIRDLNPAGIRINSETNRTSLIATRKPDYAYLSPEQTGRMNHAPDERIDLYALGVIYYEMLAGHLPLHANSAEAWVHAHLAIMPRHLNELRPDVVSPLSDMIMKLLSKAPEDRYQSAYGLLADLTRCAASLQQMGEIVPFEIARSDDASRFQLPRMLFGREAEIEELRNAFELTRAGASALIFVTGPAGIGKTTVIRELQMPVARERGRFVSGKTDRMNREAPFAPILQALSDLVRQIWTESPDKVAKWKNRLTKALGSGAAVIAQLLPEAAKLLGDVPPVQPLPPAEASNRIRRLFTAFLKVFADKKHPLVMFLDDLQWADDATMDILRAVAQNSTLQGLLIIGAYRTETATGCADNGEDHTIAAWIQQTLLLRNEEVFVSVRNIVIRPLPYADVIRFASFVLHDNTDRASLFATHLFQKTGGNPLYLHRLIDILYREKKLIFDSELACWMWDSTAIIAMPDNPDVLHLIGARLRTLPTETGRQLGIAAAIGHRFSPSTLARVSGRSLNETLEWLKPAEEEGLLWCETIPDKEQADERYYTFLHDRVQQAAYESVPEPDKANLHLNIGRTLLHHSRGRFEQAIFDIVYHLNLGSIEMQDDAEKRDLAEFNFQAGLKAKASTAYATARRFLKAGLHLLRDDEGDSDSLAFRLMLEMSECEYMCGDIDRAEQLLDQLMSRTGDLVERSNIYRISIAMNAYLQRDNLAVRIGLKALAEFGWQLPSNPSKAAMITELLKTQYALYRNRDKLPSLRLNGDPVYKALADLVMALSASVFISDLKLTAVLYPRLIRHGLKYGNNEAFVFMLGVIGTALRHRFKRSEYGNHLVETAYLLSSSFESSILKCRLHYMLGLVVQYRYPEQAVAHYEQSVGYGLESADLVFLCLSVMTRVTTHTGDIHTLSARITYYEEAFRQLLDEKTRKVFRVAKWYVAEMQGEVDEMDEFVVPVETARFNDALNNEAFYYCTCKIEISYLNGQYRDALEWAQRGRYNASRQTRLQLHKQQVYESLSLAALYAEAPPKERKSIRALLSKQLRFMKQWSGVFGSKSSACLLIGAEVQRIDGNQAAAFQAYENAVSAARREGYVIMEAIAVELASACYRAAGMVTAADAMLADACSGYVQWGAVVKALTLRQKYPQLLAFDAAPNTEENTPVSTVDLMAGIGVPNDPPIESAMYRDIDESVMRQAAGRPASADGKRLAERFLESALRYAGAQNGCVVNSREDKLFMETGSHGTSDVEGEDRFAASIVRYVVQIGEPVVLTDARTSSYIADPYIQLHGTRSILCMPTPLPGSRYATVLYLENNLAPGVFTKERLAVLEMLFSRMVYLESLNETHNRANAVEEATVRLQMDPVKAVQPLVEPLTNREMDVLRALADGLSNKEIAECYSLTEGTVKSHVYRLYGKLGVQRRAKAIARARELQLLT